MKFLVIALTLSTAVFAQAECLVKSFKYPELQSGINKKTICRETAHALESDFAIMPEDFDVVILANGYRTYQTVELEILLKKNKKTVYRVEGELSWWPGGDSYVELKK
ncbi:MAG: hypothetical protein AABZ31_13485 [Bdellovibrionota bacterium]